MRRLHIFIFSVVLFTYTVVAQEFGSIRKSIEYSFPEKIQKVFLDPLPAGTYTIGTGGNFATIQEAFDKLSTDGIAGEVILEMTDNLYTAPTDSFGFKLNGPISGAGPTSRVIIKPAESTNVTIEGNGFRVMTFINMSYLTLDGIGFSDTTTLTFHALYNASYSWNDCVNILYNSDHNIVKNITFISEDYFRYGASLWILSSSTATPDSNLILNNFIKKGGAPYIGSDYVSSRPEGNVIRGNSIGSQTDSLINWGIQVSTCKNSIIEDNIIQNLKIMNTVGEQLILGINSYSGSGDIIRNNVVHNIKAPSGYTGVGILLSGGSGSNNMVYNNMIYDIQSTSTQSNSRVAGIQIWNQINPKIYYNTVYLTGNGKGANPAGSAALYIYGGFGNSTAVDLKNNIFINARDESPYSSYSSAIYDYSASNLTSDYNDLYSNNYLVRIGVTNYNKLANWQATGKDMHSINESVNFMTSTDLHINNNYITLLDGRAASIPGINSDFDNQIRNTTAPDIGADEFEISSSASNWQMQNSNFPADVFVINFSAVNNQVCWAVGQKYPSNSTPYAGYIRTTDGGTHWTLDTISGITNGYLDEIFALDADTAYVTSYKLVGTTGTIGIYKTTDGGITWNRQNAYNSSQTGPAYIHFFDSQNGVVIGDYLETYTTTNGGVSWNPVTMPAPLTNEWTFLGESRFTVFENTIWFCTNKGRVFKSTDKGYTWAVILSESQYYDWLPSMAFQNEQIGIYSLKKAAYATDHIFRKTTNGGDSWTTLSDPVLDNLAPSSMQHFPGSISTYIAVGGRTSTMRGTAVTYDAGETWTLIDTLGCFLVSFASDFKGWGSQWGTNMVYSYAGPRITTVEEEIIDLAPAGYSLSQNYPNPFNPGTTFRYSLPQQSKVVIKVYDMLGKEIATLMDEEKSAGTYELTWNAANLASGIYFYQLKAGSFTESKKMILMK